jgi:hypothetical protein
VGKILYFDVPGPQNTDHVVAIVKERIEKGMLGMLLFVP